MKDYELVRRTVTSRTKLAFILFSLEPTALDVVYLDTFNRNQIRIKCGNNRKRLSEIYEMGDKIVI